MHTFLLVGCGMGLYLVFSQHDDVLLVQSCNRCSLKSMMTPSIGTFKDPLKEARLVRHIKGRDIPAIHSITWNHPISRQKLLDSIMVHGVFSRRIVAFVRVILCTTCILS